MVRFNWDNPEEDREIRENFENYNKQKDEENKRLALDKAASKASSIMNSPMSTSSPSPSSTLSSSNSALRGRMTTSSPITNGNGQPKTPLSSRSRSDLNRNNNNNNGNGNGSSSGLRNGLATFRQQQNRINGNSDKKKCNLFEGDNNENKTPQKVKMRLNFESSSNAQSFYGTSSSSTYPRSLVDKINGSSNSPENHSMKRKSSLSSLSEEINTEIKLPSSPLSTTSNGGPSSSNHLKSLEDLANGKNDEASTSTLSPEKVPSYRIGFPNLHQTCYLNAILQSLLAQPSFVRNLLDLKRLNVGVSSGDNNEGGDLEGKISLLSSFCELAKWKEKGLQRKAREEVLKLKTILASLDKQFQGDAMQDADEFLLKFCDTIQEQCKHVLNTESDDPITANIEFKTEQTLICSNCRKEKKTVVRDIICKLITPMSERRPSIGSLLEDSFSENKIQDWKCESCGETSTASNCVRFKQLPRVLILHIPRTDFELTREIKSLKIQSSVDIPEQINLSPIVADDVATPEPIAADKLSSFDSDDSDNEDNHKNGEKSENGSSNYGEPKSKLAKYEKTPEKPPETPEKLKNLTDDQIGKLSDEDSLALAIRNSLKEKEANMMTEEDQMNAAISESLNDAYYPPNSVESQEIPSPLSGTLSPPFEDLPPTSPVDGAGDDPTSEYRLTGVVSHLGTSVSAGHYIADIFRLDKKNWYRYNDMSVYRREWEAVKNGENTRNGYLFLYTHCQLIRD